MYNPKEDTTAAQAMQREKEAEWRRQMERETLMLARMNEGLGSGSAVNATTLGRSELSRALDRLEENLHRLSDATGNVGMVADRLFGSEPEGVGCGPDNDPPVGALEMLHDRITAIDAGLSRLEHQISRFDRV